MEIVTTKIESRPIFHSPRKAFKLTQVGNAERLVAQHGEKVRYCHEWKKWLSWDGRRWSRNDDGEINRLALETLRSIEVDAKNTQDEELRDRLLSYARRSETKYQIEAMAGVAQFLGTIPVGASELDQDPMQINCLNGTIQLKSGTLSPHCRENLITKLAPVEYDSGARCPRWLEFLERIFDNDCELILFIQKAIGYSLTGCVSEKALFFLCGAGDNGKTTLLEVVRKMLGDYAGVIDIDALMSKAQTSEKERATADLLGKRFVTSSEAAEGQALHEARIKHLTGMGRLVGRRMYGSSFEFDPQFKLYVDANHKPTIRGGDNAIWNRMRVIPFNISIPKAEQDKQLLAKLFDELPGILAWAVEGCLLWQREELGSPRAVTGAIERYRNDMDLVGDFIRDCCVENPEAIETSATLYAAFTNWCMTNYEKPLSTTAFGTDLTQKGYPSIRSSSARSRSGLALRPVCEPEPVDMAYQS
jgi:putative DNA primase/helicase